jgi:hypothetical protein
MATYETITLEQLFREELEALMDQQEKLIEEDTPESKALAHNLGYVIAYFKARLNSDDPLEVMDTVGSQLANILPRTLH